MEQPLPQSDDDDLGSPLTQGNPFSPLATGSPAAAAGGAAASSSMSPMESQLFQMMNRMSEIAAASTAAANAAALAAQVAASTTSGGGGRGSAALESRDDLKILPRPDAFKVDRLEDEYSVLQVDFVVVVNSPIPLCNRPAIRCGNQGSGTKHASRSAYN